VSNECYARQASSRGSGVSRVKWQLVVWTAAVVVVVVVVVVAVALPIPPPFLHPSFSYFNKSRDLGLTNRHVI
jgi:hypothetical protein